MVAYRNQLPEAQRDVGGLCFNTEGRAWDISEVQATCREWFQDVVTDVADLSTYSVLMAKVDAHGSLAG